MEKSSTNGWWNPAIHEQRETGTALVLVFQEEDCNHTRPHPTATQHTSSIFHWKRDSSQRLAQQTLPTIAPQRTCLQKGTFNVQSAAASALPQFRDNMGPARDCAPSARWICWISAISGSPVGSQAPKMALLAGCRRPRFSSKAFNKSPWLFPVAITSGRAANFTKESWKFPQGR